MPPNPCVGAQLWNPQHKSAELFIIARSLKITTFYEILLGITGMYWSGLNVGYNSGNVTKFIEDI